MTNEKILEILSKAAKSIADGHPDDARAILAESIERVKKDIITAEAKKSGKGVQQKALDSLYKSIKSYATSKEQPALARQHKSETTGKYYITDGYIAVESDTPFSGIPEQTENPYNFSRLFPSNSGEKLPLPAASALKAWIKSEKSSGNTVPSARGKKECVIFDFGEGKPMFNAEWLLDAIQLTNNSATKIICTDNLKPAMLLSDDGKRVILCPVRPVPTQKRRDCIAEIKYFQGEDA